MNAWRCVRSISGHSSPCRYAYSEEDGTRKNQRKSKELEERRKAEQVIKERQDFISRTDAAINKLNENSTNKSANLSFLKDSDENDRWKLMWISDLWSYYKKTENRKTIKENLEYTSTEMNQFEKLYWENQVSQQKEKWKDKATAERLKQANQKSTHWEKFKEMCLILAESDQIKEENMNYSDTEKFLCVWSESILKTFWEGYKNLNNPKQGIMEKFWADLKQVNTSQATHSGT